MKNKYQPIIGLEVHVELKTKSKMFCQCSADYFGKPPNTQTCPVCLGLPGALPVPNKKAVEWTILIAKALNCQINKLSKFDRKHYFYPDLPKGYQISQYDQPIGINGFLKINNSLNLNFKKFRIRRVHLEEDTGKLIHTEEATLVDFNRSGIPLVEIVTEPDFDNSDDVKRFLEELQVIIRYLKVSDADMEKGTMRLEPNISLMKITNHKLQITNESQITNNKLPNYKVEIKNINSFRFVKQAIDYEIERQIEILGKGRIPPQETRGFDEKKGVTYSQRSKEEAHDYRYFPEPDIPPMVFDNPWLARIISQLPELPQAKLERYVKKFGIRYQEAFLLTRNIGLTNFFEKVMSQIEKMGKIREIKPQLIANLIINKRLPTVIPVKEFVNKAIDLLTPKQIDEELLDETIVRIIKVNKKAVEDYQKGKKNALMFLMGEVMRELKGKAEAKQVLERLRKMININ